MKKLLVVVMAMVLVLTLGTSVALAAKPIDPDTERYVGNGLPSGAHYNLNIIGVPKDKTADMKDSNRHTIFVPLDENGDMVPVEIEVMRNQSDPTQFQVLDGNACDGDGALIAVPWDEYDLDTKTGGTLSFEVFAIAHGKPMPEGMTAIVKGNVVYDETVLEAALDLGEFDLRRDKGKPTVKDISDIFRVSGFLDVDASGTKTTGDIKFTNVWAFNIPGFLGYWWDYDANGLKVMQVRFYETTSGIYETYTAPS
jgi:hypothetical protein